MKHLPAWPPATIAEYRRRGWWGERALAEYIADAATRNPDGLALTDGTADLTWRGYDEASTRLARLFATRHSTGRPIAVLLPDGVTVHVAFVAGEKAGIPLVGIGARSGRREINHLLRHTGANTLVTHAQHGGTDASELVDSARADGVDIDVHWMIPDLAVDADAPLPGELVEPSAMPRSLGPDDVFLVNSTSGTTGLPKCVVHTQNRWHYFHQLAVDAGEMTADDVFMSLIPAPFGFGLWTAHFTPAYLGAPCVVPPRFDAVRALELIAAHRVTVLACVSTQFIMLLKQREMADFDLSSLRVMFTGGEAVPYEQARSFEISTGAKVLQFYGSNETGALSRTSAADTEAQRLQTAGRVIDDMDVRLFAEDGSELPLPNRGQPGCRGPALSLGYLDDAGANAQLYTADGWMLTGDIVEIDAGGYLTVVGRTSDFIIRGGKNISAAVVESEVTRHPDVALAAAVAVPDPVFGERVAVYVELVGEVGPGLELDGLVAFLAEAGVSKEYWPERLVVLASLPRAPGGKVAKGSLQEDARTRFAPASG